jgi:hypothetical protein
MQSASGMPASAAVCTAICTGACAGNCSGDGVLAAAGARGGGSGAGVAAGGVSACGAAGDSRWTCQIQTPARVRTASPAATRTNEAFMRGI